MSSHLAFQRGRALALLALLFSAVGPTWAACNGNPAAKFDPTNGQTVPERSGGNPTTVTLDGSKSTPGNNDLVFQWTYTGSTPSGLSVTLSNPAAQKPTFVAPSVGPAGATLNFSLKVTCGNQSDTQTTTVNVTDVFTNAAPVASAFISPLNANEGQTVTLDGSASSDPDGQAITYAWTQISGSPTVTLANVSANGAVKSFVAPNLPVTATLGFRLTVSDGSLTGSTDKTVSIVFNNDPPLAALNCPVGGVLTVDEGASVNFSSAGSSDPEGGALTYAWSQGIGLPNLNIGGTTTPSLSFTAPHLGYQQLGGTSITLTVTDALNASVSKTCGLFITDVTAPVIIVPYDITAEATSAAGASVSYSVTSQDAVEDLLPAPLACVPPSSSIFPLDATTIVACTDEDANHNVANASFKITVQDKTPPILAVPGDTAVQATSAAGAVGNFTATKTDLVDGGPSPATCVPATGSTFAFGDTTVTCSAVDTHGNAALDQTFVLTVMDTIAPTIDPHGDLADVEATSSAGAVVTYDAPATHDAVDGDGVADCEPPSGDTFPLGPTTITCGKTDAHGNVATPVSFGVKVVDTTAPVIAARGTETAEATSAAGALVTYTAPTWTDAVDGSGGANCLPASGTNFALGTTTVHCNKTDFAGNAALETTFDVEVVDTTPPVVEVNDDIDGVEATGPSGAVVTYLSPATHDLVDGDGVATCTPASGSTFGLGPNLVTCNAEDAHHNHAIATTFVIEVVDTTAPVLSLPSSITEEATGPTGAAVSFSPSASDIVSGNVAVTCAPLSGSTFGLGSTTVNCSAQDGAGNTATGSFTVTVQDTTAPVIAWHADVSAISLANSKAIVTYTPPTAQDLVDGAVTVSCSPASGSEFGMGSTEVKCSAQDATGNKAGSSFHVNVSYNFGGFLRPIDNVPTVNVVKAGQAIPVKFSLGGNQGLGIFATGYPKVIVTGCTGTLLDAIEETVTAGNSSLQYDAGAGQYIYVWKTDKAWAATCRQLVVKFVDGSTQVANFNFTR